MKVILEPRGRGKTTQMLEWVRAAPEKEHRIIVSPTGGEAMRLLRENRDLESWQFVSLAEVMQPGGWEAVIMARGGRIVLGLDNLDLMLSTLFYKQVRAVSLTQYDDAG